MNDLSAHGIGNDFLLSLVSNYWTW